MSRNLSSEDFKLEGTEFIRRLVQLMFDEAKIIGNAKHIQGHHTKLVDFQYPQQLEKSLDCSIGQKPETEANLLDICRKVIAHSLKTNHPQYFNLLFASGDQFALGASWLSDVLDNNLSTWEFGPVFQVIENQLIQSMAQLAGFKSDTAQGVFTPGGSMANCYAMLLARHKIFPELKNSGLMSLSKKLVMFVSDQAHYSFSKMAIILGHGRNSVVKVATDNLGRMIPDELDRAILKSKQSGEMPFMVAATSGTTVLGAHDPLTQISAICRRHKLWFHVDGALGGAWLFSRRHRHLLTGLDQADSFTWDFYKVLSLPVYCCAILVNNQQPNLFTNALGLSAEYLFQDKYYDLRYDQGDGLIQCIHRVDSFKLFLFLKAHGLYRVEQMVDNAFDLAQYFAEQISVHSNFRLVLPRFECNNVCFHFIPDAYVSEPVSLTAEQHQKICLHLKRLMMETGTMVMNYQAIGEKSIPTCFRVNFSAVPERTRTDVDLLITNLVKLGKQCTLD